MERRYDMRREAREKLAMPGQIRTGLRMKSSVAITEISPFGCRVISKNDALSVNSIAFVSLYNISPIRVSVRWKNKMISGLEFENPLYVPVLQHLIDSWPRDYISNEEFMRNVDNNFESNYYKSKIEFAERYYSDSARQEQAVLTRNRLLGYRLRYL